MAKILVIDDDAELLEMVRVVLERGYHHQVIRSVNGQEGIALAAADPPDLAIVDIMMPGMDGHEVCRRLRRNPATASVPLIVLTARGQPVDRQAALDAGATDFIAKPASVSELLGKVNAVLERSAKGECPHLAGTTVLLSLRGGVGVTTVAVNLAAALAQSTARRVCLVDLSPSSGHVALQLGLRPTPNWSGLSDMSELSADSVAAHLLTHESGLAVLAAPIVPVVQQELSRSRTSALLSTIQQQFGVVIVDGPSVLNEATMAALEMAHRIGLVTTADPPSLQTTAGTRRALRAWSDKCYLILNRPTPEPVWPADAIQRVLKSVPSGDIPFDPGQAQALKTGQPLAFHSPDAPLTQAIQAIAKTLAQTSPGGSP